LVAARLALSGLLERALAGLLARVPGGLPVLLAARALAVAALRGLARWGLVRGSPDKIPPSTTESRWRPLGLGASLIVC
jgi:hypothetical protein